MPQRVTKNIFSTPIRKATRQGQAGFDNARENIDPHIKTQHADMSSLRVASEKFTVHNDKRIEINVHNPVEDAGSFELVHVGGTFPSSNTGHCFDCEYSWLADAGKGMATFNSQVSMTGSNNINHFVGFQSINTYSNSGTMGDYYGFASINRADAGKISRYQHFYMHDNNINSSIVTNQFGLLLPSTGLTKGSGNWFLFNESTTVSYHKGSFGFGDAVTAPDEVVEVNGNVHVAGDLYFTGEDSGLPFGEVWVESNSTADTVATATSTQMLRFDTNGESNDATPDHTNDHITIGKAGKYLVTVSISFSGDPSVDWTFGLFKNNGATSFLNVHCNRKLGSGGDIGSASMSGICDFASSDTVELWMQHGAGVNKDIIVQDCTLSIVHLGGT